MEALIIGGLQGLLNYAGISFLDRIKIKKKLKKIENGTASTVDCADVIAILQKDKDSFMKIRACCEQLIRKNKQLVFAYSYLGMINLHSTIDSRPMDDEQLLASDGFIKAKNCFEEAVKAREDKSRVDYKWIDDLQVFSQVNGMLNYYLGFIHYVEGNNAQAQSLKELGLNQNRNMKGVLPY